MPDQRQLEADILQFVQSRGPRHAALTLDTDLLEAGLLDSLLLVDLILHIEEMYELELSSYDVIHSNFRTVSVLVKLVLDRLQSSDGNRPERGSTSTASQA